MDEEPSPVLSFQVVVLFWSIRGTAGIDLVRMIQFGLIVRE